jgi:Fur family iron response transcriptional regulator
MNSTVERNDDRSGDFRLTNFCGGEQGCSKCRDSCKLLRDAGLRPTRQRIALADLLFEKGDRHVSAESLFEEARASGVSLSLATVYNTLHQFSAAGLLRSISVDSSKTYFDTNTGNHNHFFVEETNEVIDMPMDNMLSLPDLPEPPEGMEIASVDIVVRVRRKR